MKLYLCAYCGKPYWEGTSGAILLTAQFADTADKITSIGVMPEKHFDTVKCFGKWVHNPGYLIEKEK